jgi:hypothetical protein
VFLACIFFLGLLYLQGCDLGAPPPVIGQFDLDVSELAKISLTGQEKKNLFRGLASSPKWKLTHQDGAVLATRRSNKDGDWISSLWGNEHDDAFPDNFQSRTILRFSPYEDMSRVRHYKVIPQGAINAKLDLRGPSFVNNMTKSYMLMELGGVVLEIFEESEKLCGELTQARVHEVAKDIADFRKEPTGAPKSKVEMVVVELQGGIYRVGGGVNSGEPGHIYFRVVRNLNGKEIPVLQDREQEQTVEYVGWSDDQSQEKGFPFEITAMIKGTGDDTEFDADFELWFKPKGDGQPRLLLQKTARIREWRR